MCVPETGSRCWAALAALALLLVAGGGQALAARPAKMGGNGGARLLLHCAGPASHSGGEPAGDPCRELPLVRGPGDLVSEYDGAADTVMVWAYLYHPCRFAVMGVGFGIRYEGVQVITSGTCADLVYQDGESMGKWARSGSDIAFAWRPESGGIRGLIAPVAWFLVTRLQPDGFFEVTPGTSDMAGAVADTSVVPTEDAIFAYGRVGFGATEGLVTIEEPEKVAGAWGAVTVTAR